MPVSITATMVPVPSYFSSSRTRVAPTCGPALSMSTVHTGARWIATTPGTGAMAGICRRVAWTRKPFSMTWKLSMTFTPSIAPSAARAGV